MLVAPTTRVDASFEQKGKLTAYEQLAERDAPPEIPAAYRFEWNAAAGQITTSAIPSFQLIEKALSNICFCLIISANRSIRGCNRTSGMFGISSQSMHP